MSTELPTTLPACPFCGIAPIVVAEYETLPPIPLSVMCQTRDCAIFNKIISVEDWSRRTASVGADAAGFQARIDPWLLACFGEQIARDKEERNHRFLEEALELVQACGCGQSEAHQLVDYTFNRPFGEAPQEVGGVMVTLAALCLANGLDMHDAGEAELARIWTKVETIRAKQAAKPKHSPLPAAPTSDAAEICAEMAREAERLAAKHCSDIVVNGNAVDRYEGMADALREAERRIRAAKS